MRIFVSRKIKAMAALCICLILLLVSGCSRNVTANASGSKADLSKESGADAEQNASDMEDVTGGQESDLAREEVGTFPQYEWMDRPLDVREDKYRNFYEIFVYSFADSNGDGIGDLNGVTAKLSYVKDMGFNAIWLMPVMQSPTYHKYDVTDYLSIDSDYGTMDDMRELVKQAHENDIRVIIDMVINHTSSSHPWFTEASSFLRGLDSKDERTVSELKSECPYVDYYNFAKEPLDNTWYKVSGCDWYYEGSFWSEMPDLNLSCDELWSEIERISSFWLEDVCVDGFRMDAVLHFNENDTEFNSAALNRLYEYCRNINPDFYMVCEAWTGANTIAGYYESGADSFFNFDAAGPEGKLIKAANGTAKAETLVKAMVNYEEEFGDANPSFIDAPFLTNHDMGRVSNALMGNPDALKMAGGLLLSMSGSPFVYYGEEIGMQSKGTKDENKRLSIPWKDVTIETRGPKDADSGIEQKLGTVEDQLLDPLSVLNYYKRALLIRNQNPEIARGKTTVFEEFTEGNHAFISREYEGTEIGILFNNSKDETYSFDLSETEWSEREIVGFLTVDNSEIVMENGVVTLPARSILYLK